MTEAEIKKLDEQEDKTRKEILSDYSNNMLIEALAGAGKTTILIDRLIEQVKTLEPAQIVAITFTEKAADELKGRFQKRLLEEYGKASAEDKSKLQNALDHINDIRISTIHSFCNSMLQEMTFEAGLGLDYEVVQDAEETRTIKAFFESFCRDSAQKSERDRLSKAGINAESLFSCFKAMCYKHDVGEWDYDKMLAVAPNGLSDTLKDIQDKEILTTVYKCLKDDKKIVDKKGVCKVFPGFTDEEIDNLGSYEGSDEVLKPPALEVARYVRVHSSGIDTRAIRIIRSLKAPSNKSTQSLICVSSKRKDKEYDEILLNKSKQSYNAIKDSGVQLRVEHALELWDMYTHSICMELLVKAYKAYQNEMITGGRITNDELLLRTRDMLINSKKARDFFRDKYRYFYIDEYQDTDPVQTEILALLTATDTTIGKPLEDVDFLDGRFCLIGDPKQSIYAFRGADVVLYSRMRAIIDAKSNCNLYQMNRNHRSNEEICSWVNEKFKKKDENDFGFDTCEEVAKKKSTQAGFDNMLSAKPSGDAKSFVKGVYSYSVVEGNKDEVEDADAKHVAAMIYNMVHEGVQLSLYDTKIKTAKPKPVEYGDFMILTRKKDGIRKYATELKKMGIPVLVNGASSIKLQDQTDMEGSPLIGFKRLITFADLVGETDTKKLSYKLAYVLVSVFGIAVPPTELFTYRNTLYGKDADDNLAKVSDIRAREALTRISEVIKLSKVNPLAAFETMAQSYITLLNEENTHEDLLSEVGALEQILEQIREADFGTFTDLNECFKNIIAGKNEKELPLGEDESKKAVHIMNAHLAKGLEANIVILACPAYEPPGFQDKVIVEETTDPTGKTIRTGYVDVTLDTEYSKSNKFRKVSAGKSAGFDTVAGEKEALHDEEELRIQYVSATRPRECLIIAQGKREASWCKLLDGILPISPTDPLTPEYQKMIYQGASYVSPGSKVLSSPSPISIEGQMKAYEADRVKKISTIESLKTVAEISIRPSDQESHSVLDNVDPAYMCGNLYGIMMHKFFELLISKEWKKKCLFDEGKCELEDITAFEEPELITMVRKAVATGLDNERLSQKQCERLKVDGALASDDPAIQIDKLTEHLTSEFCLLAEAILKDKEFQGDIKAAKSLYAEMPFELNLNADDIMKIASGLKGGYKSGQIVHAKGTMDLVLELDDRFIIWDYKSDVVKIGEKASDFSKRLRTEYEAQLNVYKSALNTIMSSDPARKGKDIDTKIYSRFSSVA